MMHLTATESNDWTLLHAIALGLPVGSMIEQGMAHPPVQVPSQVAGEPRQPRAHWHLTANGRLEMTWRNPEGS